MRDPLTEVFTASVAGKLAGAQSYRRGQAYYRQGRIGHSQSAEGRIVGFVQGNVPYMVKLWEDRGEPGWSCSCPAARDGSFCKHCVAVAISIDPVEHLDQVVEAVKDPPPDPQAELAEFVGGLSHGRLARIVLNQASTDRRLRDRLWAESRARRGEGPDIGAWRRRLQVAFQPLDRFVTYREAPGWATGIHGEITELEGLCDTHPDEAALLAEYTLGLTADAAEYVEDSDGWLNDFSYRLIDLHHRACVEGRTDPAELAARLLGMELSTDLDGTYRAVATYAEVLGEEGLAAYRQLMEPRWRKATLKGGAYASPKNYRVHEAMVGWALATGDPDNLIEAHSRTRMLPDQYLEIGEALHSAGRTEEAIEWLRRGFRDCADRPWQLAGLRRFLAALLRERGEAPAAVGLFWDAFCAEPSMSSYRRLLEEAGEEAGTNGEWARRCVEELRARLSGEVPTGTAGRGQPGGPAAVLVKVLFFQGRVEEAWSVAMEHGCRGEMWMTLAGAREETAPLDAIDVYEKEALRRIGLMKNHNYRFAVNLMSRIRDLADAAEAPDRFTELLGRVRTEHKAKRNLKKLLDDRGW